MGTETLNKLNLGCGHDIQAGYINLDSAALPGVDVVHNLDQVPLPFEDNRFTEILCNDVLEHVDLIPVLRDLHRILTPGGRVIIRVPHFTCASFYIDPTHRRAFSIDGFLFFVRDEPRYGRNYYFDFAFSRQAQPTIAFQPARYMPWNKVLPKIINRSPRVQRYYEHTFLARLFPALNVETTLVK